MEYFDFDQAAQDHDSPSILTDFYTQDFDSTLNNAAPVTPLPDTHNILDEVEKNSPSLKLNGSWPMRRASEPCFFCRSLGLDCVVAERGALQNGCTCCIALYRECSFTHTQPQEKLLETLHVVGEDAYVPIGSLTGKRALKSYSGPSTGTILEESEQRGRKSGARFPKDAVRVLKLWLSEHTSHPYPTEEERDELKAKTGLKRSQISNWLANARRRGKARPSSHSSVPCTGGVPIPGKRLPPGVDFADLDPLERWKHSPPENEPASARDIIQAMATTRFNTSSSNDTSSVPGRSHSRRTGSSNGESNMSNVRTSLSSYSFDTTQSSISDMSFASAFSHRSSRASFTSADAKERRRRRHKSVVGQSSFHKPRAARIYQCTFCTDTFPTKYDWQRHEKSLHLALDKWTCAPHGGVVTENNKSLCAFCRHPDPDDDHLGSHNFQICQEKSIQERTFYRKDHLNQHLRLMHNAKLGPWMCQWKSATTEVKSRCGFCSSTFATWKERIDHLAVHFKAGMDMSHWKGDWGFEPCIQNCIENAMPPYLISAERKTMDPWVAQSPSPGVPTSRGTVRANIPVPTDASCFKRLEIGLMEFIRRLSAQGIVPTDAMLQSEARTFIYGSDDPWNQTCADNPTWLSVLKRDAGICDTPNPQNIQLDDLGMQPPFAANGGLRCAPIHSYKPNPPLSVSSGLQSPVLPSSGFHSTVASYRGSLAGSLSGSVDFSTRHPVFGQVGDFPNATMSDFSSSAPVTADNDPLIQMGFDADFLRGLDNDEGDIGHDMGGLSLGKLGSGNSINFQEIDFDDFNFNLTTTLAPVSAATPVSKSHTIGTFGLGTNLNAVDSLISLPRKGSTGPRGLDSQ
ncbi:hypothetical protein LOZ58_001156 [Ophidiomyces ophidiicola]|nr:hypothetical protein LOZ58_001156 [Ophidiomyces ophidiicola]